MRYRHCKPTWSGRQQHFGHETFWLVYLTWIVSCRVIRRITGTFSREDADMTLMCISLNDVKRAPWGTTSRQPEG